MNTNDINRINVENIRYQIHQKKNCEPFYATYNDGSGVLTDQDNFPYTRFFRGVPTSSKPIVFEREAGWRPIYNSCYKNNQNPKTTITDRHDNCFQYPCSTVVPCYTDYKYTNADFTNILSNNACVNVYR